MEGVHALSGGASSPTTGGRPGTAGGYKRKRSGAEFESSPGTGGEGDEEEGERRRQPGVKRACNECRQQKVSHFSKNSKNEMATPRRGCDDGIVEYSADYWQS
jgi:hypothetical protein